MPYFMKLHETEVKGVRKFINPQGQTECVEFVRQVTGAPPTYLWKKGLHIRDIAPGSLHSGIAIATFDANGHYPTDALGKHAAIYLSHNAAGIEVLDQWAKRGKVDRRTIHFNKAPGSYRSDDGDIFYVIE